MLSPSYHSSYRCGRGVIPPSLSSPPGDFPTFACPPPSPIQKSPWPLSRSAAWGVNQVLLWRVLLGLALACVQRVSVSPGGCLSGSERTAKLLCHIFKVRHSADTSCGWWCSPGTTWRQSTGSGRTSTLVQCNRTGNCVRRAWLRAFENCLCEAGCPGVDFLHVSAEHPLALRMISTLIV